MGSFFGEYFIVPFRIFILIEFTVAFNNLGIVHGDKCVFAVFPVEYHLWKPRIVCFQNVHPKQVFIMLWWFHSPVRPWFNHPAFCFKLFNCLVVE